MTRGVTFIPLWLRAPLIIARSKELRARASRENCSARQIGCQSPFSSCRRFSCISRVRRTKAGRRSARTTRQGNNTRERVSGRAQKRSARETNERPRIEYKIYMYIYIPPVLSPRIDFACLSVNRGACIIFKPSEITEKTHTGGDESKRF